MFTVKKRPALSQLEGCKKLIGAELGIGEGGHAYFYLSELDVYLVYLIDPYRVYNDFQDRIGLKMLRRAEEKALTRLRKYQNKTSWIKKKSVDSAKFIADNSLDFVYIDANHSYESVKEDISLYYPKLKAGGLLSGHDYDYKTVKKAVDEFARKRNLKLHTEGFAPRKRKVDWWMKKGI